MPDIPAGTPMIPPPDLLSLAEAARLMGRPIRSLQKWAQDGAIEVVYQEPTGRRRQYVRLDDLRLVVRRKQRRRRNTATT